MCVKQAPPCCSKFNLWMKLPWSGLWMNIRDPDCQISFTLIKRPYLWGCEKLNDQWVITQWLITQWVNTQISRTTHTQRHSYSYSEKLILSINIVHKEDLLQVTCILTLNCEYHNLSQLTGHSIACILQTVTVHWTQYCLYTTTCYTSLNTSHTHTQYDEYTAPQCSHGWVDEDCSTAKPPAECSYCHEGEGHCRAC